MKTSALIQPLIFTVLLAVSAASCTEEPLGEDEIPTALQQPAGAPSSVQGYLHPFRCELWLEFQGQRRSWWACPGAPELQLSMDHATGIVFFRSPRSMQLAQLWDSQGFCPVSYESASLSREYNFWVLAVELTGDFFTCLRESQEGFYFRLELLS